MYVDFIHPKNDNGVVNPIDDTLSLFGKQHCETSFLIGPNKEISFISWRTPMVQLKKTKISFRKCSIVTKVNKKNAAGVTDHVASVTDHAAGVTDNASCVTDHTAGVTDHTAGVPDPAADVTDHAEGVTDHAAGVTDHDFFFK